MSCPSTNTWPVVGRSRPPRICSSVVLPEPDAPTIAIRSPEPTASITPCSTSRVTGPCVKFFCTPRASSTALDSISLMSKGLGGRCTRRASRRIDGRHCTQKEGNCAHAHDIHPFHIRRQVAHVIDAGIQKLRSEQPLEPRHQRFQVVRHKRTQRGAE